VSRKRQPSDLPATLAGHYLGRSQKAGEVTAERASEAGRALVYHRWRVKDPDRIRLAELRGYERAQKELKEKETNTVK
jgi:hypothetical protein